MAERPRDDTVILKGRFDAKFCVKELRFEPTLDGEWLYYNFAAGSFHIKKLCSRLYSIEIEYH